MKMLKLDRMMKTITLLLAAFILTSCKDGGGEAPNSAKSATTQPAKAAEVRIVSFSPAISRTLMDFGLQDSIVGRTPHCMFLDQAIPPVGDLTNVDYERLVQLNPTHILVQPAAAGIDPHLAELAKEKGWKLAQWQLNTIDDIEKMVREIPTVLFEDQSAKLESATARSAEIMNNMAAALARGEKPMYQGRVLIIYQIYPIWVFGTNTYLSDVMTGMGGTNAMESAGWLELSLEDVAKLNPDAIILVKPGARPSFNVALVAGPLWDLQTSASLNRRIALLTHPDAIMPCSAVVGVAEELRKILETFAEQWQ